MSLYLSYAPIGGRAGNVFALASIKSANVKGLCLLNVNSSKEKRVIKVVLFSLLPEGTKITADRPFRKCFCD